jgi:hypothetical protein
MESTHDVLTYHEELFRSLGFRLTSLETRMENLINLVRKPFGRRKEELQARLRKAANQLVTSSPSTL